MECRAATLIWTGLAGDGNILTAGNWSPSQVPSGDVLAFAGNVSTAPQLGSALSVNAINFNSGAAAFTLGGAGTFTINSGGVTNNSTSTQTINAAIKLGNSETWSAASGDLVFNGAIDKQGRVLTIDGSFNTTMSGVVIGTSAMNKNGTGTLTFSGTAANTASGSMTVNSGTLVLAKTAGVNAIAGALTIGDSVGGAGADVVRLDADFQILPTRQVTVESSGLLDLNGHSETLGSGVTTNINGGSIVTGGGALSIQSVLTFSGGGGIATGAGTLTMTGNSVNANTSGSTASISGNFSLGAGTRTFTIATGVTMNIPANISNGGIIKNSAGTLSLSGNNTFSGSLRLNTGTLILGTNTALGAGTFDFSGGTVQAGGVARTLSNPITTTASVLTIGGALDLTFSGNVTFTVGTTFTVDNTALTTFSGAIGQDASSRNFTKSGTGTLVLSGAAANTYDGTTTISTGVLNIRKSGALGTTVNRTIVTDGAALEVQDGIAVAGELLTLNGSGISGGGGLRNVGGANSWTGAITLGSPSTIASDAGTLTIGTGGIAISTFLTTFSGAGDITVSGVISGGSGGVTKSGAGTLTLSAPNTYNGGTTISGGTLIATSDAALGAASGALTISGGVLKAGGAITSARGVSIGAGGATIDTNGNTVLLSGAISGSTSLLKTGSGTLQISGALNVSTTIGTGGVVLNGATGTGAFTIQNETSLSGAGTVGSVMAESGGTLAPGDAITGLLNIGDFNLKSGAHLSIELGGTTAGAASNGYDRVGVTGGITLGGDLQGALIGGFHPAHGDLFFIIVNDGADAVSGTFAGLAQGAAVSLGGSNFTISYTGDSVGNTITGGNDVALMAVPEPHACTAAFGGIFLLAARSRRGGSLRRS